MSENKHTPDIKCYRINYNSKYWANVAAKVGNQCSAPVGAVFAVNALCDAYEDIAKQRDELLAALERIQSKIPGGRGTDKWESSRVADFNEGWNAYRKAAKEVIYAAIASVKGEQ